MAKGMPMGMMQDKMLKMHEQMHKIMQAKDPKERDKLMQEHIQMMGAYEDDGRGHGRRRQGRDDGARHDGR